MRMFSWSVKADTAPETPAAAPEVPVADAPVVAADAAAAAPSSAAAPVVEEPAAAQEQAPPAAADPQAAEPVAAEEPPKPVEMPKLTEADVEAVKQEIVDEMIAKLQEVDGAIAPQVVTAPYDPRFPTTNQNRHCFVRYNEFYKCKFERGGDDARCQFYKRAYGSLCPPEWVEEWEELREQGLWFGKY